jgi:putative addiction module component (TIGR02574 family)
MRHIANPMTLDQIVAETNHLPPGQLADLVDRLVAQLHGGIPANVEESWRQETRQRLADIQSGQETGIPGDDVSARIRKIVGG